MQNTEGEDSSIIDNLFTFKPHSPDTIVKGYDLAFTMPKGGLGDMIAIQNTGNFKTIPADTLLDQIISFNSLNNVGYAPNAVGISFSMDEGEITKPFFTDDGVVILQINSKETLSPLDNYSSFSEQLLQANKLASPLKLDKAIKEFSDIKDYRYKFF